MDDKRVFKGARELEEYGRVVGEVEGGTVSPGGAAAILRISRQSVHELLQKGKARSWVHYPDELASLRRAGYVYISVRDLVEYGVRVGRITCREDVGLVGEGIFEEVDRALELYAGKVDRVA